MVRRLLIVLALIAVAVAAAFVTLRLVREAPSVAPTSPTSIAPTVTSSASSPTSSPTQSPTSPPPPAFAGSIRAVSDAERAAMLASGSWRFGCPVPISRLRVLSVTFWGFDGAVHQGLLMVNADVARPVLRAMRSLFDARFPIHRMRLVDAYGASDERSMRADNTSAFNCRGVPGSTAWSQHAYGRAVDVNPFENPEVRDGVVDPPTAARFVDRSLRVQGMIHPGDAAVRAFAAIGWTWGGYWHSLKDYQHFSLTGT